MKVIPIYKGGKPFDVAIVDDLWFDYLNQWRWQYDQKGYARRTGNVLSVDGTTKKSTIYMHRLILGLNHGDPLQAHHINFTPLDNRARNLTALTKEENERLKLSSNPEYITQWEDPVALSNGESKLWRFIKGAIKHGNHMEKRIAANVLATLESNFIQTRKHNYDVVSRLIESETGNRSD